MTSESRDGGWGVDGWTDKQAQNNLPLLGGEGVGGYRVRGGRGWSK